MIRVFMIPTAGSPDLSGNISEGGVYYVFPDGDMIFNVQTYSYGIINLLSGNRIWTYCNLYRKSWRNLVSW